MVSEPHDGLAAPFTVRDYVEMRERLILLEQKLASMQTMVWLAGGSGVFMGILGTVLGALGVAG